MTKQHACYALFALALLFVAKCDRARGDDEEEIVRDEAYAHRKLSAQEEAELRSICDKLIDKRLGAKRPDPCDMAEQYGHVQLLPAILAVVRDEKEESEMRKRAAYALEFIADRRAVDEMVLLVMDKDPDIARNTSDTLQTISGIGIGHGINIWDRDSEGRQKVYRDWTNWWKRNRKTAKLNWHEKWSVPLINRLPTAEDVAP